MSARPKLPYLDITKWGGLNTKTSQDTIPTNQLLDAVNTDFFKTYGTISKPPGLRRILLDTYKEGGVVKPISWVGFYKASDLNGQIIKRVLVAAGTKLHRVDESAGTLVALTGSAGQPVPTARINNLVHSSDMFGQFLLIQNQDVDLVGNGDDPVKYDGTEVQRWGIIAPGSLETVRESFGTASSFTVTGGTATDEATTTQDGAAVKVNKTTVSSTSVFIEKTLASTFDASASGQEKVHVWLFIPRGQITNLASSGRSISVWLGSDSNLTTNYFRFDFTQGDILEGWNLFSLDTSSAPTGEDGTSAGAFDNTAVKTVRFEAVTPTGGTLVTGLIWDRLFTTDEGRATVAAGAAGALTGTYSYKITFLSKYGTESNAGAQSADVTVSSQQINLTNIPVSTDPQVIARAVYRTVAGGTIWLFNTRINDNSTTTFTDNRADVALGNVSPPEAGSINVDHSPPRKAGIVKTWKRTVFLAGDAANPDTLYFSEDNEPEAFPTLNAVQLDDEITGIYETFSGLVVETNNGKWQVIGDNPDFKVDKIIDQIGCVGRRAAREARLVGWAVDEDGLYIYDLNEPIKLSEFIRDKYDALDRTNIDKMWTVHLKSRNSIMQFAQDASGNYTDIFIYQYLQDVQVRSDILNGWWWTMELPSNVNLLEGAEIEDVNGDFRLFVGSEDGMLYELFDSTSTNWFDAAGNKIAIRTAFTTRFIRPGDFVQAPATDMHSDGVSGRIEPRYIEVRRTGTIASNWTLTINTANGPAGPVRDSRTIEIDFDAGQTIRRLPVESMTAAEYIQISMENEEEDVDDVIFAVRIYYHVRQGQFVV